MLIPTIVAAFLLLPSTYAATLTFNWNVGWVSVSPDGFRRPAIGINGQWPCPTITATLGDTIIVNVVNNLGNETTGIHWHGMHQSGTNFMDGPTGVTQCPIPPGGNYTYNFLVDAPGTFWYHSHNRGQYPDGLRGPLIVKDPWTPFAQQYSSEIVLTLSDWYQPQMPGLIAYYLSPQNTAQSEPIPYSGLFNDAQNIQLRVQPSTTYMIRLINMAAFSQMFVRFEQHNLTIIEVDGVYTQPKTVQDLYVAVGQRYSVLLTTKSASTQNYAILGMLDVNKFDHVENYTNPYVTGALVYNTAATIPRPTIGTTFTATLNAFNIIDDFTLSPYDQVQLLTGSFMQIVLNLGFFVQDGQNRAGFNGITYLEQKVPTLYTVMSAGSQAVYPDIYGVNANAFVIPMGQFVEIVVNNTDNGAHPMHIHGHAPQLVYRSSIPYNSATAKLPSFPMRRDTWMLQPNGVTVIRYQATNPGVWLIHCHMEWHVEAGLTATLIEAPTQLQTQRLPIPQAFKDQCTAQGIPTAGNAAGNTVNFHNLTGANTVSPPPKGALV